MLRVCHLIQYFQVGGIERLVMGLGRGLRAAGIHTTAIAYTADGPFRATLESAGISTAFLATLPGVQMRLPFRLAMELRQRRIEVLHTHHVGPFLYGSIAARLAGIPHLHTEHSRELYDTTRRRAIGAAMPYTARVVTVSPELAAYRALVFGDVPGCIPNGVEVPPPATASIRSNARLLANTPSDALVIGSVARLASEKNPALLIRSFAGMAPKCGAWLVLVGDGAERPMAEALAAELGVADRVRFLGARDDVESLLPGFDVVALASLREGLPLALLEAMANAVPVVATAVGGIPDLLATGGGISVPSGDETSFRSALETYADNPVRVRDGTRARALIEEKYSNRPMLARYDTEYRELSRSKSEVAS